MRQVISSGSVKGFYLDREAVLKELKEISSEASRVFPAIKEIRIFGSLARETETGLSDLDIFILAESDERNPLERIRPYFKYFSDKLDIALDIIVATSDELRNFEEVLKGSILLFARSHP